MILDTRTSPNVWYVGDTVKIGSLLFRCVQVYPEAFFEVVND